MAGDHRSRDASPRDPSPRVILITGASSGLGLALAAECLRRGHTVLGCGRRAGRVAAARQELRALAAGLAPDCGPPGAEPPAATPPAARPPDVTPPAAGPPAATTPAVTTPGAGPSPPSPAPSPPSPVAPPRLDLQAVDVGDAAAVSSWISGLLAGYAAPDLVVNNAGLMNAPAPLWEVPAAEFARLVDVNVGGVASVIRAVTPAMIAAGRGVIVNLSSGWGRATSPHVAPYCASKWAIEGLTRALAQELPAPLAAVAVNPGIIDTAMLRRCWGGQAGAFPSPEQWAPAAADLLLGLGPADSGASLTV